MNSSSAFVFVILPWPCVGYQLWLLFWSYFSYFRKFPRTYPCYFFPRERKPCTLCYAYIWSPYEHNIAVVECTHITNTCLVMKGRNLSWDLCGRRDDGVERKKIIITNRINHYRSIPLKIWYAFIWIYTVLCSSERICSRSVEVQALISSWS